ncbi:MAG: hypothetical protein R3D57_07095 [Hyphomicrobiaceae bacterium]
MADRELEVIAYPYGAFLVAECVDANAQKGSGKIYDVRGAFTSQEEAEQEIVRLRSAGAH